MPSHSAPWLEHRMIAEAIGQSVADAVTSAVGNQVSHGMALNFDPDEHLGRRPVPIRAIVVRFGSPLRDVMVFLSNLKDDVVAPLAHVAAEAAVISIGELAGAPIPADLSSITVEASIEYETLDQALDQCDALFLEATYGMDLPTGELLMVLGSDLLESASSCIQGVALRRPIVASSGIDEDSGLELGDQIEGIEEYDRIEMAESGAPPAPALTPAPAAVPEAGGPNGLDALDAMLAQQEQAERDAVAAIEATRIANVAAAVQPAEATQPMADDPTARWTSLLSGVEVQLSAELGRMDLALGDIASLVADSVLTLDQLVSEPVGVFVNGTRYATARLVVVNGEYGIEILEVLAQPAQLAASLAA